MTGPYSLHKEKVRCIHGITIYISVISDETSIYWRILFSNITLLDFSVSFNFKFQFQVSLTPQHDEHRLTFMINPFLTSGNAYPYYLDVSDPSLGILLNIYTSNVFSLKFLKANSIEPDQMLHSTASKLGLHCLYMPPKQISGLKRFKTKMEQ